MLIGVIPVNDLSRAAKSDRDLLIDVLDRVTTSGRYIAGPEVRAFEESFGSYVGVTECVGVGNGTDALTIALLALGIGRGSQVATCANAGFYASSAVLAVGADPVFVDVLGETACMDPRDLESVLSAGVDCVVITHLYGRMADMPQLVELCKRAGVPVIEDCAQAAGASLDGRHAGAWGDIGAFSFFPTKNLGALGDGGALTTASTEMGQRIRRLSQYGWAEKYRCVMPGGRNSRLDEIQAAVLTARLPQLDWSNERRRQIVDRYAKVASEFESSCLLEQRQGDVAHLAVVVTPNRDAVSARLRQLGVGSDVHYPIADHQQPVIRNGNHRGLPETEALTARVLSVPAFPDLTDGEVEIVCEALKGALAFGSAASQQQVDVHSK